MGRGEFRVFNQVLPQQPQGGVDKLAFYTFDIEEVDALLHVLKRMTERLGPIKGLESLARFFLAIAHGNAHEFLDAEIPGVINPHIFNRHRIPFAFWVLFKPQTARAVPGIDMLLPQIERFHKVTVRINNTRHGVSPFLSVSNCSHGRRKLFHLCKELIRPIRCGQHV